jgi:DNA-binding NtrC family response regulator
MVFTFMPGSAETANILIVDDEERVAETLALILSTLGYAVRVATSAENALEIMTNWRPDLAILDVMLPKMNGIDLAIIFKVSYPDCRVLLFSGQPEAGALLDEAHRKGYLFEILPKPLHPDLILSSVKGLLSSRTGRPADA